MTYAAAFLASFVMVFLKATQQLNVMKGLEGWVIPVSYGMAAAEVYIISTVADYGYGVLVVIAIGTGAWIGAIGGIRLHKRFGNGRNDTARS